MVKPLSARLIQGFHPLNELPSLRLNALLEFSRRKFVRQGEVLFAPGLQTENLLFLFSGQIRFEQSGDIIDSAFRFPLQHKYQRNDTARAQTDCSLLEVHREALDKLLCWTHVSSYIETDIACQRNLDTEAGWMATILHSNLFQKVPPLNFERLYDRLVEMPVTAGQVILQQGDVGDCCYFIKEGVADVTRRESADSEEVFLAEIGYGRCFGEDALVHETVRNATVAMTSDGLLMKMDKRDFVQLLKEPTVDSLMSSDLDMALQTGSRLLDVRSQGEYEYSHLRGSLHAPLNLLRIKSRLLDRNTDYVVYCDTGRRARAAVWLLEQKGFRARALTGGLATLPEASKEELLESGAS